jgi:DNA-binding XRE family transcriptional regulator
MDHFGRQLSELRKQASRSQADLASAIGVSQATISRLEAAESCPTDIRLLSKIAKALNEPLNALVPEQFLEQLLPNFYGETFSAFCPNPFCDLNAHGLDATGAVAVSWKSWDKYDSSRFDEVNFCHRCGTELVKDCPSCKHRFDQKSAQFCMTCGTRITSRPTAEEWKKLHEIHEAQRESDIPF